MRKNNQLLLSSVWLERIIIGLLGLFLFLAGLGEKLFWIRVSGVITAGLLIGLAWVKKRKIKIPRGFRLYGLFIVLLFTSLIWSHNVWVSFELWLQFLAGGLFWLGSYNLKTELSQYLDKVVIILGLVFGGLFIVNDFWGEFKLGPRSLYLPYTNYNNHNSIGELWAVVLAVVGFYLLKQPKKTWWWVMSILGIYFLLMSQSRTALLAVGVGGVYLFKQYGLFKKYKRWLIGIGGVIISMFLFLGTQKSIISVRPYYIQSIAGLIHHPLGVGLGNFREISLNPANQIWGLSGFSSNVHSIVFEIMSGMGWLGLVFLVWLVKIGKEVLSKKNRTGLVYRAAWLAMLVNMLFFSSYFIPAMLWLWFLFLGLI